MANLEAIACIAAVLTGAVLATAGVVRAQAPATGAAPAAVAQGPAVMIVFDGSGSMWGKIEGTKEPKFTAAREALRAPLSRIAGKARLGLMSFGHRRQGTCSDIEVIAPAEPGPPERVMAPLDKLNPRGKGPIAQSLREAGKALAGRGPASIILLHDNADNCQQDMCAAAEELGRAQIKVFAVGLGLEGDEPQRMACVAQASGGRFVNAMDAGALATALNESVDLAVQGRVAAPAAEAKATKPEDTAKAPRELPANTPPGLALAAQLRSDGGILEQGVRWRVTGSDGTVHERLGGQVVDVLPPGKYTVEATAGLVSVQQTAEVGKDGPTRVTLALPAGLLRVTARAAKASEPLAGAVLSLFAASGKAVSGAQPLSMLRAGELSLVVPPGDYVVRAEAGQVRQEAAITVAAGKSIASDLVLNAGRLQVSAEAGEGGEAPGGVTFMIAEDDPDAPQGRREIARSAAERPEFVLPAGTYYVTAKLGPNEVRQRIAVGAGETVKKAVPLGLSKLTVVVSTESAVARLDPSVQVKLWRLEAPPREVGRSFETRSEFLLTPGRYRIEAQAGGQNARAEGEVELKAGHNAQASVKMEAAAVSLRAVEAGGAPIGDAFWEIRDGRGRVVWRTSQSEPKALLAPGRYVVRSEARSRTLERTVDVASGEVRTLELKAQ